MCKIGNINNNNNTRNDPINLESFPKNLDRTPVGAFCKLEPLRQSGLFYHIGGYYYFLNVSNPSVNCDPEILSPVM
jgi:hypothetical protein